jgi:hypothetical protein
MIIAVNVALLISIVVVKVKWLVEADIEVFAINKVFNKLLKGMLAIPVSDDNHN